MQANSLQSALAYAERGFSVIPIRPDKKPFIKWEAYQTTKATPEEIKSWFTKWPNAMIGICTGDLSGLLVVDCDNEDAYQKIQDLLPDSFVTCIAKTPRGYHIYLVYPKGQQISNAAGIMPGVDVRGQGGYIIAPGSVNTEGKAYTWLEGLGIDDVPLAPLPCELTRALFNESTLYEGRNNCYASPSTMFENGRRDNDLFHVANSLTKGGMPAEEIAQVLKHLIISWGEKPDEKWIADKIESAKKRDSRRSGDVTRAIEEWVSVTDGYFSVTDCRQALQPVTDSDQTTFRVILHRLAKRGLIEKHGNKDGVYRRIDTELEKIDFLSANSDALALQWPFGIQNFVKIHPGNIIGCAGESNSGKTALALNFARLQQDRFDVHYFSSEMGKTELRERLLKFPYPLESWKVNFWERSSNFADVIRPDAINIIDFLEIHDEFYKIGLYIKDIFDKLKTGIAFILIQKNKNTDFGLGGMRSLEKARLYLAMEPGRLKIVKAKNWASQKNPNGLSINFKLVGGCDFHNSSPWEKTP